MFVRRSISFLIRLRISSRFTSQISLCLLIIMGNYGNVPIVRHFRDRLRYRDLQCKSRCDVSADFYLDDLCKSIVPLILAPLLHILDVR
jgi:hypothetical protein